MYSSAEPSQFSTISNLHAPRVLGSGIGGFEAHLSLSSGDLNVHHTNTAFFGFPMAAGPMGGAPGAMGAPAQPGQPEVVKPIDTAAEISRINSKIMMYNIALGAAAVGSGLATCLFAKSILQPARKGVSGGDSDEDEDDDDESDESDD